MKIEEVIVLRQQHIPTCKNEVIPMRFQSAELHFVVAASCGSQVTGETEVSRLHQVTNQPPFPLHNKK